MSIAYFRFENIMLEIITENDKLKRIDFMEKIGIEKNIGDFEKKVKSQLNEYFEKSRKTFDLEFDLEGTEFQKKVWKELLKVPFGQTVSYGEIADRCGSPKGARAVGMACNKNKLPIVIPCHRVVGKNGEMVGFVGGLETKIALLKLEN